MMGTRVLLARRSSRQGIKIIDALTSHYSTNMYKDAAYVLQQVLFVACIVYVQKLVAHHLQRCHRCYTGLDAKLKSL